MLYTYSFRSFLRTMSVFKASLLFLLITMIPLISCNPERFEQDMVFLDQSFVPAWYYLRQADAPSAQPAILFLEHRFAHFRDKYAPLCEAQPDCLQHYDRMNAWLKDAHCALDIDDHFTAMMQLDHFRFEMIELREQMGIPYYLDLLWEYERNLDEIVDIAVDPQFQKLEWNEMSCFLQDLSYAWKQLAERPIPVEPFGMNNREQRSFENDLIANQRLLKKLLHAFDKGDGEAFLHHTVDLELHYYRMLITFGDFSSARSYLAHSEIISL